MRAISILPIGFEEMLFPRCVILAIFNSIPQFLLCRSRICIQANSVFSILVCIALATSQHLVLMLSIEDLLNPLPISQHALEPDSPTSFANHCVMPDFDTTTCNSLMAEGPAAFNTDPSSIQASPRSCSSPSTCCPHSILHHAHS
jgi:hypothetical protein